MTAFDKWGMEKGIVLMSSSISEKEKSATKKGPGWRPKTQAQNKKIWALKSELCLSEETLRDVVESVTRQRSISKLSSEQAAQVIKRLSRHSRYRRRGKGTASGNVIAIASPKQKAMIHTMAKKVRWNHPDGFQRFLESRLGLTSIKTSKDVTKVRKALDNMIAYQNRGAQ